MSKVVVLGAGQSAPFLIQYLLEQAERHEWTVVVADRDEAMAEARIRGHARGQARYIDAMDLDMVRNLVSEARVVVNFLAPMFQIKVARICVELGIHMVSASYLSKEVEELHADAEKKGVTLLCEMGVDPGIDHMSAMRLIHEVQEQGGIITGFASYGSGVPAPECRSNPLGYAITWNPRNVVMAAESGAQYLEHGKIKIVPYPEIFHRTWPFEVEGVGTMEGYPNRDSLSFRAKYGLANTETFIRGTLRYPGFCETWYQIARLGLPNEVMHVPNLPERTWAELVEMFIPSGEAGEIDLRTAAYLGISPSGIIMDNLRWMELFSDRKIGGRGDTPAQAMVELLKDKLKLLPGQRDMVVLAHQLDVTYPQEGGRKERITSTMAEFGTPDKMTAMAKTVGLPAAIGARLLMVDAFPRPGAHIPTDPAIYRPMLKELEAVGLKFVDKATPA